jgi:hypothetical protein
MAQNLFAHHAVGEDLVHPASVEFPEYPHQKSANLLLCSSKFGAAIAPGRRACV